jgi:hypothetical protein
MTLMHVRRFAILGGLISSAAFGDPTQARKGAPLSVEEMAKQDVGTWSCDEADPKAASGSLVVSPRFNGSAVHLAYTEVTPRNGASSRILEWSIDATQMAKKTEVVWISKSLMLVGSSTDPSLGNELVNPFEMTDHPLQRLHIVADRDGMRLTISNEFWRKDKDYSKGFELRCEKLP